MRDAFLMSESKKNGGDEPERMIGTIIRLLPNRGYGFVRGDDGFTRFFSVKEVSRAIDFDRMREGSAVRFTPIKGNKGNKLRAADVELLSGESV